MERLSSVEAAYVAIKTRPTMTIQRESRGFFHATDSARLIPNRKAATVTILSRSTTHHYVAGDQFVLEPPTCSSVVRQ
jgi:hypothetical protein